jgi:hypothetical protein
MGLRGGFRLTLKNSIASVKQDEEPPLEKALDIAC